MSNASNALEGFIGDHLLRTATWTKPAGIYVALFTTMPAEDGTGGVEVSGGAYARVQNGPSDAAWNGPVSGNGEYTNAGIVSYAVPTANWGTVVGFGLYDASTGGTMQVAGTLATSRTINSGDPAPNFPVGALKLTVA